MRALALELAPKNIRVNCVSPGMVKTDMSIKILESISEDDVSKIESMHPLGQRLGYVGIFRHCLLHQQR